MTPEEKRAKWRESQKKRLADPEKHRKYREYQNAYRARQKASKQAGGA